MVPWALRQISTFLMLNDSIVSPWLAWAYIVFWPTSYWLPPVIGQYDSHVYMNRVIQLAILNGLYFMLVGYLLLRLVAWSRQVHCRTRE